MAETEKDKTAKRFPLGNANLSRVLTLKFKFLYIRLMIDINDCYSYSDVVRKLGKSVNGTSSKYAKKLISENSLDTSHFRLGVANIRYKVIEKVCPVCGNTFKAQEGHKREKQTCSHSCSNTYFRSGENNPNWKDPEERVSKEARYRRICFSHHPTVCVYCGEDKTVAVHHYDEDHTNESPDNLIPLCPTHHMYIHSRYRDLVQPTVDLFRDNFLSKP